MINPAQFITLFGVSFFGTFTFFFTFWFAGIVRTNVVWFIGMFSLSMLDDSPAAIVQPAIVESPNVINHRSSSVRAPDVKLVGTLSIAPAVRPVAKIYSSADRERARASIRVCRIDSVPEMIVPSMNNLGSIGIIERRYEPTAAPLIGANPETLPTSDIFGP